MHVDSDLIIQAAKQLNFVWAAIMPPSSVSFLIPKRTFLTPKMHLTGLGRFGRDRFAATFSRWREKDKTFELDV
jgi:hypothetical protein